MQYDLELVFVKNNHVFVDEYLKKPEFIELMRRLGALGDGNQDQSKFRIPYLWDWASSWTSYHYADSQGFLIFFLFRYTLAWWMGSGILVSGICFKKGTLVYTCMYVCILLPSSASSEWVHISSFFIFAKLIILSVFSCSGDSQIEIDWETETRNKWKPST